MTDFTTVTTGKIEVLRQVLGTMVQEPIYQNNSNGIIGEKEFKMYIQKPIVEGNDREVIKDKLLKLVNQL